MKIKKSNYLGLNFTSEIQTKVYAMQKAKIDANAPTDSDKEMFAKEVYDLLITQGNRNYLMTKPSLEIASRIRVSEEKFDGRIFAGLPVGKKITIMIDEKLFFRYLIMPKCILCVWITLQNSYVQYTTFRINTDSGTWSYPKDNDPEYARFEMFLRLIIFLEFSELETVTLKPNQKTSGTRRQGKYVNSTDGDVVIVDSTWNKVVVVTGEFSVCGHLRLQPYGTNRLKRKLIYIDEFTKNGYVRNPKKELVENGEQNANQ